MKSIETRAAAGGEGLADVALALVDEIGQELVAGVPVDVTVERVQQGEHRRRDDRLLHRFGGVLDGLREVVRRERLVAERPARQPWQLTVVTVVEDGEILAVTGEVRRQAGTGQGVGQRVRGEARRPLLTIGHDRGAGRLHPLDRVAACRVLFPSEVGVADLAGVVGGDRCLQRRRPR